MGRRKKKPKTNITGPVKAAREVSQEGGAKVYAPDINYKNTYEKGGGKKEILLKEKRATDFELEIDPVIYEKIMTWVDASENEVSWFGTLVREGRVFRVKEIFLMDQEVSGSETEINDEALSRVMHECIKNNAEGDLNWWGHSHVDMSVFWSAQDMHTIREIGRRGWVLASVFNQKREIKTAFLQSVDVLGEEHDLFVDDIPTYVVPEVFKEQKAEWMSEYRKKVKENKSSYYQNKHDLLYGDGWYMRDDATLMDLTGDEYEKEELYWGFISAERILNVFNNCPSFERACATLGAVDLYGYEHCNFKHTWALDVYATEEEFMDALMIDFGWGAK